MEHGQCIYLSYTNVLHYDENQMKADSWGDQQQAALQATADKQKNWHLFVTLSGNLDTNEVTIAY